MKIPQCEKEQQVLDALHSGRWGGPWGEEIRQHASHCPVCAEVVLVVEALRHEEELGRAEIRLPGAGLVWWKAQLAARRAAAERAAQPIVLIERVAQALGILSVLGFALFNWPQVLSWLGGARNLVRVPRGLPSGLDWAQRFASALTSQPLNWILLTSAGLLLTLMVFAAYAVWREE